MFHISTLGGFGYQLKKFADLDGYIPEPGDRPQYFRWGDRSEWDSQSWTDFIAQACQKTRVTAQEASLWDAAS
jgi:hypothetical protein